MKEFFRTSKVTVELKVSGHLSLLHADDDVEYLSTSALAPGARRCRVNLLDERGALKSKAAGQVVTLVDGGKSSRRTNLSVTIGIVRSAVPANSALGTTPPPSG